MSNQLLSSKIVTQEEEPTTRPIQDASTSDTGVVGITERGPVHVATLVQSPEEYSAIFGGFTANSDVALAAQMYFDNGGTKLWVVRVVHVTTPSDRTTFTSVVASVAVNDGATTPALTLTLKGKTPGTYANSITAVISAATDAVTEHFDLTILRAGRVIKVYPNLSMTPTDPNYVGLIESDFVAVVDAGTGVRPANATVALSGGADGLGSLSDADFTGNAAAQTGLRALDQVPDLRILMVPARATAAVHNAIVTYCDAIRFGSVFAVLGSPANMTAQQIVTYVTSTASLKESTEFAAIYWPRVKIANPSSAIYGNGDTITVCPSGAIAGLYARNDAKPGGVYEAPAGQDFGRLFNVLGLETNEAKDETKRDLVFPNLINPIVGLTGLPIHVDGARTLKSTSNFPTIGERRGVIFIEQSLKAGLVFGKHRKIKASLLAQLQRTSRTFLLVQTRLGAFASDDPKLAFNVDFGPGQNPPTEAFGRRVNGRFGLATSKPAEFIILRFGQDTRALEAELAKATAAA